MPEPKDQTDVLAQVEQLTAQLATAKTELSTAKEAVTKLTADGATATTQLAEAKTKLTSVEASLATVTQERDALKVANTTLATANTTLVSENTALKEEKVSFNKKVATELVKHGVRPEAILAETPTLKKDVSLTEQCIAANAGSAGK